VIASDAEHADASKRRLRLYALRVFWICTISFKMVSGGSGDIHRDWIGGFNVIRSLAFGFNNCSS